MSSRNGVNHSLKAYMKLISIPAVQHIAGNLQRELAVYEPNQIAKVWVEAVLIELLKTDLLMKFKGEWE